MGKTNITIIVPVYNAESYLRRCVDSILAQTFTNFELLLVNDGSKDKSGEICDEYERKDERIRVFHKENGGVSSARNLGLDNSRGEWILFLDSDDALEETTFETLITEQRKENVDCVVFGIKQESGSVWAPQKEITYTTLRAFKQDFSYWLNTELLSPSINKFFRKSLVASKFNERLSFGEDLIFSIGYFSNCQSIRFIKDQLYLHNNLNENSITHSFNVNRVNDIECWQKAIIDFANPEQNPILNKKYIGDILKYIRDLFRSDMSFHKKREIADTWYNTSYWKAMKMPKLNLPTSDKFILYCINHKAWRLLETMWQIKKVIK